MSNADPYAAIAEPVAVDGTDPYAEIAEGGDPYAGISVGALRAPQHKPWLAGAGQAAQNALLASGQAVMAAPALVEAAVRSQVGPAPTASDPSPLGTWLALLERQRQGDAAAASYDPREGVAGFAQEGLDSIAASLPGLVAPMATGAQAAALAPRLAPPAARVLASVAGAAKGAAAQTFGMEGQQAPEGEATPTARSVTSAAAQAVLEGFFTKLGGATGVEAIFRQGGPQAVRRGVMAAAKELGIEAGKEGGEEAATSQWQDIADQLIMRASIDPARNVKATALGGITGVAMGGAVHAPGVAGAAANALDASSRRTQATGEPDPVTGVIPTAPATIPARVRAVLNQVTGRPAQAGMQAYDGSTYGTDGNTDSGRAAAIMGQLLAELEAQAAAEQSNQEQTDAAPDQVRPVDAAADPVRAPEGTPAAPAAEPVAPVEQQQRQAAGGAPVAPNIAPNAAPAIPAAQATEGDRNPSAGEAIRAVAAGTQDATARLLLDYASGTKDISKAAIPEQLAHHLGKAGLLRTIEDARRLHADVNAAIQRDGKMTRKNGAEILTRWKATAPTPAAATAAPAQPVPSSEAQASPAEPAAPTAPAAPATKEAPNGQEEAGQQAQAPSLLTPKPAAAPAPTGQPAAGPSRLPATEAGNLVNPRPAAQAPAPVVEQPKEPKASAVATAAAGMKPKQSKAFNEAVTQAIADVAVRLDGGETGSVKLTSAALAWLRDVDVGHTADGKPTKAGLAMAREIVARAREAQQHRAERRADEADQGGQPAVESSQPKATPVVSGEPAAGTTQPAVGDRVRVMGAKPGRDVGTVSKITDRGMVEVTGDDGRIIGGTVVPERLEKVGKTEETPQGTTRQYSPDRPLGRSDASAWGEPAGAEDVNGVEPIAISGSALAPGDDIAELRQKAAQHLNSLRGQKVLNADSGNTVLIDRRATGKAVSGPRKLDELRAIAGLPATIERALFIGSEPSRRGDGSMYHHLAVPVSIDGRNHLLNIVVREQDGLRFYDQHFLTDRLGKSAAPAVQAEGQEVGGAAEAAHPAVAQPDYTAGADQILPQDQPPGKPGTSAAPERRLDGQQEAPAPFSTQARIPVAPLPPGGKDTADAIGTGLAGAIKTLRSEFSAAGIGDPQLAAGEAPAGTGGMYDEANGVATLFRSNDLDAAAHEAGHFVAHRFRLDEEGGAQGLPLELAHFAQFGSVAPLGVPQAAGDAYRRKEAWAEFIRAMMVNPAEAARQAPAMASIYAAKVPAAVRDALDRYGEFGRRFMGLPAHERTIANIEHIEELIGKGVAGRAMAGVARVGEAVAAAGKERGAMAKVRQFLRRLRGDSADLEPKASGNAALTADETKAYAKALGRWQAFRWKWNNVFIPAYTRFAQAWEIRGQNVDELPASRDFRVLNRLLAGTDGKVIEQVFGDGLRDASLRPVVDHETGQRLTWDWLMEPVERTTVDPETGEVRAEAVARKPADAMRIINKAMAYGTEQRTAGRGDKLLAKAGERAQEFVEDLDAFVAGEADVEALNDIMDRWRAAGLPEQDGKALRVEAMRLVRGKATNARELAKFTGMYGSKVRADAAEKAARLTGIGAGMTSDHRQAKEALRQRENDPDKAVMDEFLRRYRRWAHHLVQYLAETGVVSADQARSIIESDLWTDPETGQERDVYLDLHRLVERDGSQILPGRRFSGSTRTISNPLANLIEGTLNAIARGDRNRAMLALVDAFRNRDADGKIADDVRDSRLGDMGRIVATEQTETVKMPGGRVITRRVPNAIDEMRKAGQTTLNGRIPYQVVNNGVKEWWTFDPWVEASLEAARRQGGDGNLLLRAWAQLNRLMRATITTFPAFMVRNILRDTQGRLIASETATGNPLKGVGLGDIVRGFGQAGGTKVDTMRRLAGASYAGYQDGREELGERLMAHLSQIQDRSATGKAMRALSPGALLRLAETVGERAEALNRNAEFASAFDEAKAKGWGDFDAYLYAGDKTRGLIDFAEAGVYGRQLNRLILFINPALQGLARVARTASLAAKHVNAGSTVTEKAKRLVTQRAVVAFGLMAGATLLLRALRDKEDEEKWRQQDARVRDFHWIVPMPGSMPDLAIPREYSWGIGMAGAERLADYIMAKRSGNEVEAKRAMEGYAGSAMGALLPINDVASLMGGFAPIVEATANYDFFRQRHLIPAWEEAAALKLRDTSRASWLGKLGQDLTDKVGLGVDARKIDHIVESYLGNWGRTATSTGKPPEWWLGTVSGLFKNDPAGAARDVQWVYDTAAERKQGQSAPVKNMTRMLREARNAPTAEERQAKADAARKVATRIRQAWEKRAAGVENP